ncbi:TPM domain-containing protein [Aequorivita echinoideorum]|uniref:TPM domain-containing protein n=1 Tax=Aequorivita echinoideorum TaxID=1549647 RepID=A0ABS5S2Q2_9FLAO|nr:TPM domain-containing protein [Aequorivita echinoideorum]MBT0606687.1 TPM domain-containing protein [Aequorivita echinoideorum]
MSKITGYGAEKILTDSICNYIIDNVMIPLFKEDKYYKGIDRGVDAVIEKWSPVTKE